MKECKFCGKYGTMTEYIVAIVHTIEKKYMPEEIRAFLCDKCIATIKGKKLGDINEKN
jgi:hypothetical protein